MKHSPIRCEVCNEKAAKYRVTATNLDGELLYLELVCEDCVPGPMKGNLGEERRS